MDRIFDAHLYVGEDGGNGFQKSIIADHQYIYPSWISQISELRAQSSSRIDLNDVTKLSEFFARDHFIDQMDVTISSQGLHESYRQNGRFFVGRNAKNTSRADHFSDYQVRTDTRKAESDISFICLLSLIAYHGLKEFWQSRDALPLDMNIKVDFLATALPLNEFKRPGIRTAFKKRFEEGTHEITIHSFSDDIHVNIIVDKVNIMPEGYAANLALIYDPETASNYRHDDIFSDIYYPTEDGKPDDEAQKITSGHQLKEMLNMGVDIGDGSVDITFNYGADNRLPLSIGLENGIGTVAQEAIDEANQNQPNSIKLRHQELVPLALNGTGRAAKLYRSILSNRLDIFFRDLAQQVSLKISNSNSPVQIITVSGGGAIALKDKYRADFINAVEGAAGVLGVPILFVPPKYAQGLNLSGLRILLKQAQLRNRQSEI